MKIGWFSCGITLLCVMASAMTVTAQEYPRELKFTPAEQQIWQLTMQRPLAPAPQILSSLQQFSTAETPAWWWLQRCRFALQAGDKTVLNSARAALKQLENQNVANEFAGSAAGYKCQQLSKFSAGESMDTRQLSFLAYHSLTARDAPALHAWVGLDYARDALQSGFYDSAANAIGLVLSIARRNQLPQLEADSLAVQAEIQHAAGQEPEALRSINQALPLQTDPRQLQRLQLTQAEILLTTGRQQEAQALYQTLWQQRFLPAGMALLTLYLQQSPADVAPDLLLKLSTELQQQAVQSGDREWIALSRLRHAMVLLVSGQPTPAQLQFDDASGWLLQHRLALYVPELQRWAQLLSKHGQPQAAFDVLQQNLRLQRQLDAEEHNTQAQLSSTLLIAEQRSRELKLVELQQQLQRSRVAADEHAAQIWRLSLLAAALAALLLLLLWHLVRRRG
ncbi:hypothetical protein [Rheinheimera texasensis]|uniref:hypothetical protein n=1 Tax=Rheinheimera texasensis TaxID=306205 RepID=UPI0032B17439